MAAVITNRRKGDSEISRLIADINLFSACPKPHLLPGGVGGGKGKLLISFISTPNLPQRERGNRIFGQALLIITNCIKKRGAENIPTSRYNSQVQFNLAIHRPTAAEALQERL